MKSLAYKSWRSMRARCRGTGKSARKNYSDRGITICDRWNSFALFLKDMGERPAGTTIDRIDNDGNYEPKNCRWATPEEQHRNRRRRPLIDDPGIHGVWLFARWFAPVKLSFKEVLAAYAMYCDQTGTTPVTDRALANALPVVGVSKRRSVYVFDRTRIDASAAKSVRICNSLDQSDMSTGRVRQVSNLVSACE